MATKSQRKKQKAKQRQRKRLKARRQKRPDVPLGNSRHSQRLERQQPRAWDGELREDVAIFDDVVFKSLPPELASQVTAVREALTHACESRRDAALERVSSIPRSSPLSQWRLFVRGLVSWMANDTEAACAAWQRTDPKRRPGRIAITMMTALRNDLDRLSVGKEHGGDAAQADWCSQLDSQLLYQAKLLRRVRIDRGAIRVAEVAVRRPEESSDLLLGPKKIRWLRDFAAEYRSTEPDLVAALEYVALRRAFCQRYCDLFDEVVAVFSGPRHDRRNSLLSFFYYLRFNDGRTADQHLKRYLDNDLPENEELSRSLRQAVASQIHLNEAEMMIGPAETGMIDLMFGGGEDTQAIKRHFAASVRAYPANRDAYRQHVDWIESKLDDRLTKSEREPLERQLLAVMHKWSKGLPDDVEPRLWLADYLLENEQTEDAKPHVDWLAGTRHEDPRVRAAPWKWQLLEAMRLSRRKAWLTKVPSTLDEADSQWPAWLSQQWLPYLKAAWSLRCNETDEFEHRRDQICDASGITRDSLADACMMLAAAQRMRVSAVDLKPLRAPVDAAVANLGKLPVEELLTVCGFFWDLHRTSLLYPAYRMHGGKFVRELSARLDDGPGLVVNNLDDERIRAAVFLCSEHRVWDNGFELTLPAWCSMPAVERHVVFAAARLNSLLKLRSTWRLDRYKDVGAFVRDAAQSQTDPYYRHWFVSMADQLDEALARNESSFFGFSFPWDDFFDDDDEDEDFDPDW